MELNLEYLRYGDQNQYSAYVAAPKGRQPLPAVIVVQEIWGVDEHIESVTRRFAEAGYVAFAPDLFSASGVRPVTATRERLVELRRFMDGLPQGAWGDQKLRDDALAKRPPAERQRISDTFGAIITPLMTGKMDFGGYVKSLSAGASFLRQNYAASRGQKVGAVGFCMGGALSAQLACVDPQLGGAVIFYGRAPATEQIPGIKCPVIGLYGDLDVHVNEGIPAFEAAMKKHGKSFEAHVYKGTQHAFFNDERPSYNAQAATDAFARTLAFFKKSLA